MKSIEIYDSTLRDGTQDERVNYSVTDKISLIRALDDLGVDYIEAGWPSSNPKDMETFLRASEIPLKTSKLVAFGSTHRKDLTPDTDANLEGILKSGTRLACIYGKSSRWQVGHALLTTPRRNLEMIRGSVRFLCEQGRGVFYDAEHFFDAFKEDKGYAFATLDAAIEGGADRLVLCDTNGGTLPAEFLSIMKETYGYVNGRAGLGVHCHNDSQVAVANSLIATPYIVQVQGTMNGFGERVGNANLCSIIPGLFLKGEYTNSTIDLRKLKGVSELFYMLTNLKPDPTQPYVGDNAFRHKGGGHVDAICKAGGTAYEHIDPESVGNKREIVLSDLAGKANILMIAKELGYDIEKDDARIADILSEVKSMEKEGYDIGPLKAEKELLIMRHLCPSYQPIEVTQWKIMTEYRGTKYSECVLKGRVGGAEHSSVAPVDDEGPVGATYQALQNLVAFTRPEIRKVNLSNYKVRIAEDRAADSSVRVYVEFRDNGKRWGTAGVSTDILEASLEAVRKGFEYYIQKE